MTILCDLQQIKNWFCMCSSEMYWFWCCISFEFMTIGLFGWLSDGEKNAQIKKTIHITIIKFIWLEWSTKTKQKLMWISCIYIYIIKDWKCNRIFLSICCAVSISSIQLFHQINFAMATPLLLLLRLLRTSPSSLSSFFSVCPHMFHRIH